MEATKDSTRQMNRVKWVSSSMYHTEKINTQAEITDTVNINRVLYKSRTIGKLTLQEAHSRASQEIT